MDIFFGIIFSFVLLISSVYIKIFVAYPLVISLIIFMLIAIKRGNKFLEVVKMAYFGGKKAFIVLQIFIIIGAIISIWIAAGTVPALVYFGIKFLNPNIFILSAFLISCFISFLIGTSFGTIGTVGIAFMVMGRTGGVNVNILGGAIIAGAYFGDRCSPMSSSANLVANITNTNLYINIKGMFKTSALPFFLSLVGYLVLSFIYPLNFIGTGMEKEIARTFKINFIVLLPALSILTFAIFKVEVKLSMAISIIAAFLITILVQHQTILNSVKYIVFGYSLNKTNPLNTIMQGGGVLYA